MTNLALTLDQALTIARSIVASDPIEGFEISDAGPHMPGFTYRDREAQIGFSVDATLVDGQPALRVSVHVPSVNSNPRGFSEFLTMAARAGQLASRVEARFFEQPLVF